MIPHSAAGVGVTVAFPRPRAARVSKLEELSESESVWSLSKNEMMVGPDPQTLRVLVTPVSLGPTGPDALTNLKTVQADF